MLIIIMLYMYIMFDTEEANANQDKVYGVVKKIEEKIEKKIVKDPNPKVTGVRSEDNKRYLIFVGW